MANHYHNRVEKMESREQVSKKECWNVESLYPTPELWEKALENAQGPEIKAPFWPEIDHFQGNLKNGPEIIKNALELILTLERELVKIYTYAHLRHDEDLGNSQFKEFYERSLYLLNAFSQETAWFQAELLEMPQETLEEYLNSPLLKEYKFYIEKLVRLKPHTLSAEGEKLLALASQPLQTAYKAFNALTDADFQFGEVVDGQGQSHPLSHSLYAIYLREQDRVLRKNAFEAYHAHYKSFENTICNLLNGQIQAHLFDARARNYPSCLEAALYSRNIEPAVYHSLVKTVNDKLPSLHKYMELRKKVLKLKELHLYDVYVPLTAASTVQMDYEQAENCVIDSVTALGEEYQSFLRKGLKDDRWVDRYENKNKRSGAYSSGCYDSAPYILMNYKPILRDVFTLAHEAGHSMHSLYSRKEQPYHLSDYPIFLAEVASTFNEDLLMRFLLNQVKDKNEKIFLLNQKIEDIRSTLFRQTMFAEFEYFLHGLAESGTPLTPELLNREYIKLNEKYFGKETVIDKAIESEWTRIPHFYYGFYVFQYATGISAALALSERVNAGSKAEREAYLSFLKSGSSRYPIDTLKLAGVDMTSPQPVVAAIEIFDKLVIELEELMTEK